ncbi:hypothetical protein AKJ16_DCAP25836 [Drosera capensis]
MAMATMKSLLMALSLMMLVTVSFYTNDDDSLQTRSDAKLISFTELGKEITSGLDLHDYPIYICNLYTILRLVSLSL